MIEVGKISLEVIKLLDLPLSESVPIYVGELKNLTEKSKNWKIFIFQQVL